MQLCKLFKFYSNHFLISLSISDLEILAKRVSVLYAVVRAQTKITFFKSFILCGVMSPRSMRDEAPLWSVLDESDGIAVVDVRNLKLESESLRRRTWGSWTQYAKSQSRTSTMLESLACAECADVNRYNFQRDSNSNLFLAINFVWKFRKMLKMWFFLSPVVKQLMRVYLDVYIHKILVEFVHIFLLLFQSLQDNIPFHV